MNLDVAQNIAAQLQKLKIKTPYQVTKSHWLVVLALISCTNTQHLKSLTSSLTFTLRLQMD